MELANKHFSEEGYDVIYFNDCRYITTTVDEVDSVILLEKMKGNDLIKDFDFYMDQYTIDSFVENRFINSGYHQLMNFIGNSTKKCDILLVDMPEISLHIYGQKNVVKYLYEIYNPELSIIVTHAPSIIGNFMDNVVDINTIVNLY